MAIDRKDEHVTTILVDPEDVKDMICKALGLDPRYTFAHYRFEGDFTLLSATLEERAVVQPPSKADTK